AQTPAAWARQREQYRHKLTPGEIAAGLTEPDLTFGFEPGHLGRYGVNEDPGVTDMAAAIQRSIDATGGCYIPASLGEIYVGSTVNVPAAGYVVGDPGGGSQITSPAGVVTFLWQPGSSAALQGPSFHDLR